MDVLEFYNYITKPLSEDDVNVLLKANNIVYERRMLYYDYVISLIDLIDGTYMGDDIMGEAEIKDHFKWCWDKTIDNFKKENIEFTSMDELYNYFYSFMSDAYYNDIEKYSAMFKVKLFYNSLFSAFSNKTKSDIDALVDLYKLFDKSFKIS